MAQEVVGLELDLFSQPPVQTIVKQSEFLTFLPINPIEQNNAVEFNVGAFGDKFKNLNEIFLTCCVQILKKKNEEIYKEGETQPYMSNAIIDSLIKSAVLSLNNVQVVAIADFYSTKSYIEHTLSYSPTVSNNRMPGSGYFGDPESLKKHMKNSKKIHMIAKLNLINCSRYLIPGVSVNVKLTLQDSPFYLIEQEIPDKTGEEAKTQSVVKIHSMSLMVKHVQVSDSYLLYLEHTLARGINAIYNFKSASIITSAIPVNSLSVTQPAIYSGIKPLFALFAMIESSKLNGDFTNPHVFSHNNLSTFSFLLDGKQYPAKPFNIKYDEKEENFSLIYHNLIYNLDMLNENFYNHVTYDNFMTNFFYITSDFSNVGNLSTSLNLIEPLQLSQIGFTLNFHSAVAKALTGIFYLVFPREIRVSALREIGISY